MGSKDIHTKKRKKPKKEARKAIKVEPLAPPAVEVVHKRRKESTPE